MHYILFDGSATTKLSVYKVIAPRWVEKDAHIVGASISNVPMICLGSKQCVLAKVLASMDVWHDEYLSQINSCRNRN